MYKLELLSVKYIPILIAFVVLLNAILSFVDIYLGILNSIAGTSVLNLIPMYTSSYAFKSCEYHRMFIHYIMLEKVNYQKELKKQDLKSYLGLGKN